MNAYAATPAAPATRKRYLIVGLLFVTVVIDYLDRSNLSIAAPSIASTFQPSTPQMGWILSAWRWAYAAARNPGGWLADRVPPRRLAALLVLLWSCATLALGFTVGFASLFAFRLLVGLMEAPSCPINNRVVTTWVPETERAPAIGIHTSAQFVGLAFLTPVLTWLYTGYGWMSVFMASGAIGIDGPWSGICSIASLGSSPASTRPS